MSRDKSAIQGKIEAIMRLAEDPGASQAERDLALSRVSALIEKHAIDAADLNPHSGQFVQEEIVKERFVTSDMRQLHAYRVRGFHRVVLAFGAGSYRSPKRTRDGVEELVVFAPVSVMESLRVLLPMLQMQEMAATEAYIKHVKKTDGAIKALLEYISEARRSGWDHKRATNALNREIRHRRQSFCLAWYTEVARKLEATRQEVIGQEGSKYLPVLVDTKTRIAQAMAALGLKDCRDVTVNRHGWAAGTEAGRWADIGQQRVGSRLALT